MIKADLLAKCTRSTRVIDTLAGGDMLYAPPSSYGKSRILAATMPSHVDAHYVFDIETMGRRPDLLHLGVLMTLDTQAHRIFRTWDEIEDYCYSVLFAHLKTRIWAHYGSSFDFVGLADHVGCTYGKPAQILLDTDDGEVPVTWSIEVWGNRQKLTLQVDGRSPRRIDFVDSSYHMPGKLSALGAKGKTPLQYTNPDRWLRDNLGMSLLDEGAFDKWFNYIDDDAVEYCIQDCKVLADALRGWREFWLEEFKLDALDYLTSSRLALHGCITKASLPEKPAKGKLWYFVHQPETMFNRPDSGESTWYKSAAQPVERGARKGRDGKPDKPGKLPVMVAAPLVRKGEYAQSPAGWSGAGRLLEAFEVVATGGRAEVFANRTRPGMRPFVIDINSTYPAVNAGCQLTDPRFLVESDLYLEGKSAILERLKKRGGMYQVELASIDHPAIKKYPINWIRLSAETGVEGKKLAFIGWTGILRTWMTGEELAYALEFVGESHHVVVTKAIDSQLIPLTHSPNAKFSAGLFNTRRKHEMAAKAAKTPEEASRHSMFALFAKLANNSGSFGIFSETHCHTEQIIFDEEGDLEEQKLKAQGVVQRLVDHDPLWSVLTDPGLRKQYEDVLDEERFAEVPAARYIQLAEFLAQQWGIDYFRSATQFTVRTENGSHRITEVPVDRYLAPHSIKCWAAQITAHARVKLHRALVAADQAGFQVCYVDTDSLHLGVPAEMTDEDAVKALTDAGVPIGEGLGDWKVEHIGGKKALGEGAAVAGFFLAPKVYAYVNATDEVIYCVCKGIPADYAAMRVAMSSISAGPAKIGSKQGIRVSKVESRDAMANILRSAKRNYIDAYSSTPVVIEPPKDAHDWKLYLAILSRQVLGGDTGGVAAALRAYEKCTFRGQPVKALRRRISDLKDEIDMLPSEGVRVDSNIIAMVVDRKFKALGIADPLPDELALEQEIEATK